MKKLTLLLFFTLSLLMGAQKGSVSLFVFFNGEPYKGMDVNIDGKVTYTTDAKGLVKVYLEAGRHEAKIIQEGTPLAYLKFNVAEDENTQAIVTLNEKGKKATVDVEEPGGVVQESSADRLAKLEKLPKGYLVGKVISSEKKEPVSMVKIYVKGLPVDATTDTNGSFNLALPEGNYSLSVIHPDYATQAVDDVVIVAKKTANRTIEVTPSGLELAEFVVLAPHIEGSVAALLDEKKKSSSVAEILGAEQFSKQGDSDAAGALKRANGLTLIGGKYVYVRGLGERYSSSLLNGLHLPSPEPTKRVVPLDMFPTSVIKSIKVQKTYAADLPANFGGGNIDIRTKDVPESFFFNIGLDMKYNEGTTFEDVKSYQGGSNDWTGIDEVRALSGSTLSKTDNFENITDADTDIKSDLLKSPSQVQLVQATPGYKLSASVGDRYNIGNDMKFGYIFTYNYADSWDSKEELRSKIALSNGVVVPPTGYQTYGVTEHEIKRGGLLNLSLDINEKNRIKQTNFFINHTTDTVSLFEGTNEDSNNINRYNLAWVERSLMINQLEGNHDFQEMLGGLRFNWAVEQGKANRNEPLTREYTYVEENGVYTITPQYSMGFVSGELDDSLTNSKMNIQYPFFLTDGEESLIEIGTETLSKERDSKTRRYSLKIVRSNYTDEERAAGIDEIFSEANLDDFRLGTTFKPADYYKGYHDIQAQYLRMVLKPLSSIEIVAGMRNEVSEQRVDTYDAYKNEVSYSIEADDSLPEFIMTYKISDAMQVRGGYSKTVTRPDFREFAPTRYQDPTTADIIRGNEELTYTEITSYDLSWEWYLSTLENLSFGIFQKQFTNPIETIKDNQDTPTYQFINAEGGYIQGMELGFRKDFSFFGKSFGNYYTAGNYSVIDSRIELSDATVDANKLTNQNRPMQGQSPYVINLALGYDNNNGRSSTLVYNMFGKRIMGLGTEEYPDVYEEPFKQLDFVWIEKLAESFKVKFKFKNILDDSVRWTQAGYDVRTSKKGRELSLSMEWKY